LTTHRISARLLAYLYALFVLYFAFSMLSPVLPLYLEAVGLSPLLVGVVIGVLGVVRIPLAPVAGALADVLGRKRVLLAGLVLSAAGTLLLLLKSVALLVAGRALVGVFGAFLAPVAWALVSEEASERGARGGVLALANAVASAASVAAPALAGYLASALGFESVISVSALLLLAAAPAVWAVPSRARQQALREALRGFFSALKRAYWCSAVFALEWYMLFSWMMLLPLYASSLGYGAEVVGLLMALEGLVYALCQPLVGYLIDKHESKSALMLTAALAYGLSLASIPRCRDLSCTALLLVAAAVASSPISPVAMARASEAGPGLEASVMGALFSAGYLGMALGSAVSGFLAQASYQLAFAHLAVPGAAIALLAAGTYLAEAEEQKSRAGA
jgi:MFS family permease